MSILVEQTSSATYPPRTFINANNSDLTVAFAVDFDSAGEKLTHRAAGDRYIAISLETKAIESARILYKKLRSLNAKILNVAGNGIYTLTKKGWTQDSVDQYVFDVLSIVHEHWPLEKVISGGQTGIDIAGVTSAHALGIPVIATLPNGYLQRSISGVDSTQTHQQIIEQITSGAERLRKLKTPKTNDVKNPKFFEGKISSLLPNQIFVFGSNPVGINGNPIKGTGGAALAALLNGWVRQYEKMDNKLSESGLAWGLTTVTYPGKRRSKTPDEIIRGIIKLYDFARANPQKEFLVASGSTINLNGYSNEELANLFNSTIIPDNMVFEREFSKLVFAKKELMMSNECEVDEPLATNKRIIGRKTVKS